MQGESLDPKISQTAETVFYPCRVKLHRANLHIIELKNAIERFFLDHFVKIRYKEIDSNWDQMRVFTINPVKGEYSGILGDAIHNLRSVLDLAVCSIARAKGLDDSRFRFPFSESESSFADALKSARIHELGEPWPKFISSIKPYDEINHPFRSLHKLDIIDKHRSIIPTVASVGTVVVTTTGKDGITTTTFPNVHKIENGEIIAEFLPVPKDAVSVNYGGQFRLVFPDGVPFAGLNIVEQMIKCSYEVNYLVGQFERIFDGRGLYDE